jgi:hypothetical protein
MWRKTAALAAAGLLLSITVQLFKQNADAKRESTTKATQEQTKADLLSAIDRARNAIDALASSLGAKSRATADVVAPQIDVLRRTLQNMTDDVSRGTGDSATLLRTESSLVQMQNSIAEIAALLKSPPTAPQSQSAALAVHGEAPAQQTNSTGGSPGASVLRNVPVTIAPNASNPARRETPPQNVLLLPISPPVPPTNQPAARASNHPPQPTIVFTQIPHARKGRRTTDRTNIG